MRTALVVGATGLIGSHVVDLLLADPTTKHVVVLARRKTGRTHDKLTEHVVDFEALDASASAFEGVDDVYACLGTTIKVAGSQEKFRRVDHDYTVEVAGRARKAGASRLALVSSIGASERTGNFYLRVKGETERDVKALGYESLVVARPSLLLGHRTESRPGEAVGAVAAKALSWALVGGLRAYRPIAGETVARAMIQALSQGKPGTHVLTFDDMTKDV